MAFHSQIQVVSRSDLFAPVGHDNGSDPEDDRQIDDTKKILAAILGPDVLTTPPPGDGDVEMTDDIPEEEFSFRLFATPKQGEPAPGSGEGRTSEPGLYRINLRTPTPEPERRPERPLSFYLARPPNQEALERLRSVAVDGDSVLSWSHIPVVNNYRPGRVLTIKISRRHLAKLQAWGAAETDITLNHVTKGRTRPGKKKRIATRKRAREEEEKKERARLRRRLAKQKRKERLRTEADSTTPANAEAAAETKDLSEPPPSAENVAPATDDLPVEEKERLERIARNKRKKLRQREKMKLKKAAERGEEHSSDND